MTNIHQLRLQTRIDSSAESGTREGNVGVTVPGQYTDCIDFKVSFCRITSCLQYWIAIYTMIFVLILNCDPWSRNGDTNKIIWEMLCLHLFIEYLYAYWWYKNDNPSIIGRNVHFLWGFCFRCQVVVGQHEQKVFGLITHCLLSVIINWRVITY